MKIKINNEVLLFSEAISFGRLDVPSPEIVINLPKIFTLKDNHNGSASSLRDKQTKGLLVTYFINILFKTHNYLVIITSICTISYLHILL